jgi:hypothetical protein
VAGGWKVFFELYLLEYKIMQSVESQPKFRRNMSPPSSGSKKQDNKVKQVTRIVACDISKLLLGTLENNGFSRKNVTERN